MGRALQLESALLYIFAAIYLAGAGVNTQTMYAATTGFHGSMLFTLSMPVSRRRLLLARAGLGAILTGFLVAIVAMYTLVHQTGGASAQAVAEYLLRALVCTMAVYALSVLLACVLDEMWQFMGGCFIWVAFFLLQSRFAFLSSLSPLRGMSLICYPLNAPMPWITVWWSLAFAGVFICASVHVLQRKEY
jgi:ABC-type transport system involved in multi-copper enzyme maturation permease subunit